MVQVGVTADFWRVFEDEKEARQASAKVTRDPHRRQAVKHLLKLSSVENVRLACDP